MSMSVARSPTWWPMRRTGGAHHGEGAFGAAGSSRFGVMLAAIDASTSRTRQATSRRSRTARPSATTARCSSRRRRAHGAADHRPVPRRDRDRTPEPALPLRPDDVAARAAGAARAPLHGSPSRVGSGRHPRGARCRGGEGSRRADRRRGQVEAVADCTCSIRSSTRLMSKLIREALQPGARSDDCTSPSRATCCPSFESTSASRRRRPTRISAPGLAARTCRRLGERLTAAGLPAPAVMRSIEAASADLEYGGAPGLDLCSLRAPPVASSGGVRRRPERLLRSPDVRHGRHQHGRVGRARR